jgi:L-alanine-DL-glutamate epimerase-like enolase superfamily enzyme
VKIDRVSHSRVAIALHETFRTAIRETDSIDAIRVEIHASGRVGIGYATATPAITGDTVEGIESFLDQTVIPYLIGREIHSSGGAGQSDSAMQLVKHEAGQQVAGADSQLRSEHYVLGAHSNSLFGISNDCYEAFALQCSSGMAGIDLALHDLVFTSPTTPQQMVTSVTIGAGTIEAMVATAHRRRAAGFRVVKAKLGADPEHDAQRLIALAHALGAIRDRRADPQSKGAAQLTANSNHRGQNVVGVGGLDLSASSSAGSVDPGGSVGPVGSVGSVALWVDANQGWTVAQALEIFDAALDADVVLGVFEQPTAAADLVGLRQVREGVRQRCHDRGLAAVPVVADESARTLDDVDRIIAAGAADAINVKFMKFGGITGSGMAVAKAQAAGLGVLVGSMMEHPHSVAAAVRFASSLGGVHDLDAGWWARDTSPLSYVNGYVSTGGNRS